MAQIEIGSHSKSIQYVSIHKEAYDDSTFCGTDDRWNTPIIQKQNDYLVAISKFEVPLNRVPITNPMPNCIEIYKYADEQQVMVDDGLGNGLEAAILGYTKNVEHLGKTNNPGQDRRITWQEGITFLETCEALTPTDIQVQGSAFHLTPDAPGAHTISMPACSTVYEFVQKINAQIQESLLMNSAQFMIVPRKYTGNAQQRNDGNQYLPRSEVTHNRNLFGTSGNAALCLNKTDPIARFEITVDSDSTFSVKMNHVFSRFYYIKMSQPLFDMLQFKEKVTDTFDRLGLPGRRFMGDRIIHSPVLERDAGYYTSTFLDMLQGSNPPYSPNTRPVNCFIKQTTQLPVDSGLDLGHTRLFAFTESVNEYLTSFVAPTSAADSIVRIKSLVFSSSLATTSESASGNTFRRVMTDFTVPVSNSFSWNPNTNMTGVQGGSVSENAPSELSYTNPNPSGGRWLMLSDPSPLYELKMDVHAKCWNFETRKFDYEQIPLPPGSTFTCKLVFISRNELYHQVRPDSIHKS